MLWNDPCDVSVGGCRSLSPMSCSVSSFGLRLHDGGQCYHETAATSAKSCPQAENFLLVLILCDEVWKINQQGRRLAQLVEQRSMFRGCVLAAAAPGSKIIQKVVFWLSLSWCSSPAVRHIQWFVSSVDILLHVYLLISVFCIPGYNIDLDTWAQYVNIIPQCETCTLRLSWRCWPRLTWWLIAALFYLL